MTHRLCIHLGLHTLTRVIIDYHVNYSCVYSHQSIYSTSVLKLGKPIIGKLQLYVSGGTLNSLQAGTY